jgi:predicted phage terminase large subunit-like protein
MIDVLEIFYGGAAGGGKTVATLMAASQFLHVPGYAALLLRENFSDLGQPKAWIPLSKEWWLNDARSHWNAADHRWTFDTGGEPSTITFGYLQNDDAAYQYDSASYQFIAIDELTQHTEWRYRFMFGRIRRPLEGPLSTVPLRMRSTSNPGNKGHDWVKRRFISPDSREPGAVFIPAMLNDNAGNLDIETYRRDSLAKLDPITRAQREHGDWDAHQGGRFKREWFRRWRRHPVSGYELISQDGTTKQVEQWRMIFQTCDPAASEKRTADYTVLSTWGLTKDNVLIWLDCERWQREIPDLPQLILASYKRWRPEFVAIEGVAANSGVFQLCNRLPMSVSRVDPLGEDKLVRATSAMNLAHSGRLYLPCQSGWLEEAEAELVRFTGDDKQDAHDDIVDTLSYAAQVLQGRVQESAAFLPYGRSSR